MKKLQPVRMQRQKALQRLTVCSDILKNINHATNDASSIVSEEYDIIENIKESFEINK